MKILLARDATVDQLKQEVENNIASSSLSIQHNHSLLVVQIGSGKIQQVFSDIDSVRGFRPTDNIYVYQLPYLSAEESNQDWIVFPVYCSTTFENPNPTTLSSVPLFGLPIVLAAQAEELKDVHDIYSLIAYHIERYCIVKLFEEDTSSPPSPMSVDEDTDPADIDLATHIQEPIQTTAAVTPAGRHPMVPMPNLFSAHVFEQTNKAAASDSLLMFPAGKGKIQWDHQPGTLHQGQGVVIEWNISKAQQIFGTYTSSSGASEINTQAWFDYVNDSSSSSNSEVFPISGRSSRRLGNRSATRKWTLEDCLNEFTNDEQLDNGDSWFCPRCKKHQRASKKMDIWKLPDIMVIHLKRFSQMKRWGSKVDTLIDFPLLGLDMTDRVLGNQQERLIYDLYAIDNHYGSIESGHYTAYAKNIETLDWYDFDDSHVSKLNAEQVKSNAAYLLFYKRRQT